jgi:hypothetical protein
MIACRRASDRYGFDVAQNRWSSRQFNCTNLGVTGWDLADTAIKIGLGSVITAVATIIAVSVSRSTELKKEARRRRQDALEAIVDKFESAHSATTQVISVLLTYARISRENNPTKLSYCLDEAQPRVRAFMGAKVTLFAIVGRCQMMKLGRCSAALDRYMDLIEEVTDAIDFVGSIVSEEASARAESQFPRLEDQRRQIHESLSEAFYSI